MSEEIKQLRQNTKLAKEYFMNRLAYTLGPAELKKFMDKGGIRIVDVRSTADYQISHIPGAISIPKDELEKNLEKLSKEEITIVYCYNQQCHLGEIACLILADYGYPVMHMEGGFDVWVNNFRYTTVSE